MNHNGVISLPAAGALTMGEVVKLNASGQAESNDANNAIGVVLHDTDPSESDRPVDVQLFSAGGIALVQAAGNIAVGAVAGTNGGNQVTQTGTGAIGIALEAAVNGDIIKVIL
jgi:hypothetical protein